MENEKVKVRPHSSRMNFSGNGPGVPYLKCTAVLRIASYSSIIAIWRFELLLLLKFNYKVDSVSPSLFFMQACFVFLN